MVWEIIMVKNAVFMRVGEGCSENLWKSIDDDRTDGVRLSPRVCGQNEAGETIYYAELLVILLSKMGFIHTISRV